MKIRPRLEPAPGEADAMDSANADPRRTASPQRGHEVRGHIDRATVDGPRKTAADP